MIKSFKIVNNLGESLELDIRKPEVSGFLVVSVTGLTYPNAEISSSEIALFDGAILGNRRVGQRNIVMTLTFYRENTQRMSIEELRHKCYRFFPIKQEIIFYVTNDSGTYKITGYVEANETNIFTKEEGAQISILCPDPYFVKENVDVKSLISKIVPNFSFPCSFEFEGEPVPGYPYKYDGPFVFIPDSTAKLISLKDGYSYGDIIIAKYMVEYETNTGGGDTATIKGDDSIQDYVPSEPDKITFNLYEGSTDVTPTTSDITLQTGLKYFDDDITIEPIPVTRTKHTVDGRLDNYTVAFGHQS